MISSTIPHVGQIRLSWDNREVRFAYTIKPDPRKAVRFAYTIKPDPRKAVRSTYTIKPDPRKAKRCLNYTSLKSHNNRGDPMNPRSPVV